MRNCNGICTHNSSKQSGTNFECLIQKYSSKWKPRKKCWSKLKLKDLQRNLNTLPFSLLNEPCLWAQSDNTRIQFDILYFIEAKRIADKTILLGVLSQNLPKIEQFVSFSVCKSTKNYYLFSRFRVVSLPTSQHLQPPSPGGGFRPSRR